MIKTIAIISAILFALAGSISLARADCASGITLAEAAENFTKNGAQVQVLTPADVSRIIDTKGAPPNGEDNVPYEMILVLQNGMGAIFVSQNDCLINRIGPAPEFVIQQLFGQVSAIVPYHQTMLMKEVNFAAS